MRPVTRGPWPTDESGHRVNFDDYTLARGFLIERIGGYCSFCGMRLDASLAVEHVLPKQPPSGPRRERVGDWHNFLLACQNCNSNKGNADISIDDCFWPHLDNTMRAIQYLEGGLVQPHMGLDGRDLERAKRTITLTGLDKVPGLHAPKASDRRWQNRRLAWDKAKTLRGDLEQGDSELTRRLIVEIAVATGYWPAWFTVFHGDFDMLNRLRVEFPGTAEDCFDRDMNTICRPGGKC
jgi:hypothetical protein